MRKQILEAGGSLDRQDDSVWVIVLWFVPRGKDYTEVQTVYGFFPADKFDDAKEFVDSLHEDFTFSQLRSLNTPSVAAHFTLRPHTCCHCGEVVFRVGDQWHQKPKHETSQYCWVDPVSGSQLHEVEAEDEEES